ncbi:hypothetical protein GCE86_09700 [Micromonospora terminaliae]|uniref:Low temperature requirement protein A n=1 Tax=Micromonospora terminaliae TaxID=1914461 RepID=A0AAJ2ZFG0_9ACTN|nr:hypothetical protein [Micromonospora terminaliae]NES27953.1 low temperature requirement protein A [Micromonospora terminaliae]QGL47282.1 hypothetical protein GCE86_09700 [Micromonospora terminaliae]
MIAGIVLVSLGLGKTMSVLGSWGLIAPGAPLNTLPHLALFVGVITYLLADHAIRWRMTRRVHPHRIAQALRTPAPAPAPSATSFRTGRAPTNCPVAEAFRRRNMVLVRRPPCS